MREAIHILMKDIRHLWPWILGTAILTCITTAHAADDRLTGSYGLSVLVAFAAPGALLSSWWLILSVIHEDALPGERQFWLTRPVSRGSLLTAKLLFITAFVAVPVLLTQIGILIARGVSPIGALPALLLRLAFLAAWLACPPLLFAIVTRTVAGAVMAGLGMLIGCFLVYGSILSCGIDATSIVWGSLEWLRRMVQVAVIAAALALVIWLCYWRRRILAARIVAGCAVVLVLLPQVLTLHAGLTMLRHFQPDVPESVLRITYDPRPVSQHPDRFERTLALPIRVSGLPAGVMAFASAPVLATGNSASGGGFGGLLSVGTMAFPSDGKYWLPLNALSLSPEQLNDPRMSIRVQMLCTLLRNTTRTRMTAGAALPEDVQCWFGVSNGVCQVPPRIFSRAALGLWDPRTGEGDNGMMHVAAAEIIPTDISLRVLDLEFLWNKRGWEYIEVTGYPYAQVERTFEAANVRLADYEVPFRRN